MTAIPQEAQKKTAPYVAFASFKSFLAGLREPGVPIVIDNSVFGNMSGSLRSQLKGALKFFAMIDDGNKPTPGMRKAVEATASPEQWKAATRELLESHYAPILAHPLPDTTPAQLQKEFQANFAGSGDSIDKAIAFFIFAAKEAGISLSPRLTERQRGATPRRPGNGRRRQQADSGGNQGAAAKEERVETPPPNKPRKVHEHQTALIEIINTYTDMDVEMRKALLDVVGFIAMKGVVP